MRSPVLRLVATISLALLMLQSAWSQELWQGTKYQMSVQEVAAIHPAALFNKNPKALISGDLDLLNLPGINISGADFTARFYFKDDRLSQVTLGLEEKSGFDRASSLFDGIAEAVRAKYGREQSTKNTGGQLMRSRQSNWQHGRVNINVILIAVAGADVMLNINYQVRVAQTADKL